MMTLNETLQMMRLTCALGLMAVGLSTAMADRRYEAKGTEFDITGKIIGDQVGTRMAMGSNGGYLVWQDNATDEFGLGISALRIDLTGNPVGAPVRINSSIIGDQEQPRVGLLKNGGAIFVWEGGASGFHRVHYRVTNQEGLFIMKDRFVTSSKSGEQLEPAVAVLKNGQSVIVWTDYLNDGSFKGVSGRVVSSDGESLGEPFHLNKFTLGNQHKAQVVAMPDGRFAAAWISDQQQNQRSIDVILRIFSANGQPVTEETIVSPLGISSNPTLTVSGQSIVVAWEQLDLEQKVNRWDIGTRSFDFNLKPLSESIFANLNRKGDQYEPQLNGGVDGAMLVWTSLGQDKSREAIMGRFVNSTGNFVGGEIRVNTKQELAQMQPTLSSTGQGEFLVAWSTPNIGEAGFDIVGQRYSEADNSPVLLPGISVVYVNPVSQTELLVSWPAVKGLDVEHYEVYFDGLKTPKFIANTHVVWPGLRPGSEYSFKIAYKLKNGLRSELSQVAFSKTWGHDYNGDGMPDDWQRQYFGDVANWPAPHVDSDADGASNADEFAAGTNPSDKSDSLNVSITNLERGRRMEWDAKLGSIYQLQETSQLESGWVNVDEPVLAIESRVGITLESVKKMKFYRIKKIR